jgi:tocopherol cyclase
MQSPLAFVEGVRHPEAFHGRGRSHNFFEGWYIKLVSPDAAQRWAVIPGIFRGLESAGNPGSADMAFVQVLDGQTGRSWFHEYPVSEFRASTKSFDVWVGDNHFSPEGVELNLPQLKGSIQYTSPLDPWPVTLASPGIMGWYGLVPFMECFHGIVSFGHGLSGEISVEGKPVTFDAGRGYIEKDWGRAFPSGYVWMQSNHFASEPEASLIASVAIIPWLGGAFRGFIIGLKHHGKLHKWTTYNKTREVQLSIDDTHVVWIVSGPDGVLEIVAERAAGGLLHAPLRTAMYRRVEETMQAVVAIRHLSESGNLLFEDSGLNASMEVFGDLDRLLKI